MAREQNLSRRLFSLSGILPLGFFLLEHTWANASALRGQDAYVATATSLARIPLLPIVEVLLVFAPLAFHAAYGAWMIASRASLSSAPSPLGASLARTSRVCAAIALVFIAWHFWETRVHAWRAGVAPEAFYATLAWRLSSVSHGFPTRAVLYLVGVTATVAHFALGAYAYGVTSGWFPKADQKKRAAWGIGAIGVMLFVASVSTVISLATGSHFTSAGKTPECAPTSSAK
jgi:succinate dehydrogenase/fumarate reductase cytochrome b subunit (b558 family)